MATEPSVKKGPWTKIPDIVERGEYCTVEVDAEFEATLIKAFESLRVEYNRIKSVFRAEMLAGYYRTWKIFRARNFDFFKELQRQETVPSERYDFCIDAVHQYRCLLAEIEDAFNVIDSIHGSLKVGNTVRISSELAVCITDIAEFKREKE